MQLDFSVLLCGRQGFQVKSTHQKRKISDSLLTCTFALSERTVSIVMLQNQDCDIDGMFTDKLSFCRTAFRTVLC